MVDEQGVGFPEHGKLLFIGIVLLGHIEVVELPLDESESLHTNQQFPCTIVHNRYLQPRRTILQTYVYLLSTFLSRFNDHSQHEQPFNVVPAGRWEALVDRMAHHWHFGEEDVFIEPYRGMDGPEFLGEELPDGFEMTLLQQVSLWPQLKVAPEGIEQQHATSTVQQCADVKQHLAHFPSRGLSFIQSCYASFGQDRTDADQRVIHPIIEIEELRTAEMVLRRQHPISIPHSLPQYPPIVLQLFQLYLYLVAFSRFPLDIGPFVAARTEENIRPCLTASEEWRGGDEVCDWYFEGVFWVGSVPDVEGALVFAARLYLLDVVLVKRHGCILLDPKKFLRGKFDSSRYFFDQLPQSRVELIDEGRLGQLRIVNRQEELQRTVVLHTKQGPIVRLYHELQPLDEILSLWAIPDPPEICEIDLFRVQLVVDKSDLLSQGRVALPHNA